MNRNFALKSAAAIGAAMMLMGCQADSSYRPNADPTVLSSTAAKTSYPSSMSPEKAPDMFYSVEGNGVITLYNAGDTSLASFTVWVAKSYSLFVDKLPAHTSRMIVPETVFNSTGGNLMAVPPNNFLPIEVLANGHLYDLPGPVHPMQP